MRDSKVKFENNSNLSEKDVIFLGNESLSRANLNKKAMNSSVSFTNSTTNKLSNTYMHNFNATKKTTLVEKLI